MAETDIDKEIISRVIGRDVLKLNLSHKEHAVREHTKEDGESITLRTMDFSALIKDEFGKEIQVLLDVNGKVQRQSSKETSPWNFLRGEVRNVSIGQ